MSDEFRRLWEQRETLQRMTDPLGDLRRHIDPLGDAIKRLEIDSATLNFLRQGERRSKMLSHLADVGGITTIRRLPGSMEGVHLRARAPHYEAVVWNLER